MAKKIVKVKFAYDEPGYCRKYYRTIPNHQLICNQEGDGWMHCINDGVWNEPTSHINEDKYELVITEAPTTLELFCDRVGWVIDSVSYTEAQLHFENEMTEEDRDNLCAELADRVSELADPETANWFTGKRLELIGLVINKPRTPKGG